MAEFGHLKVLPFRVDKGADTTYEGCPAWEFSGWASLAVEDCEREVVEVGFFDAHLAKFLANPVMRWMHARGDVCGRWLDVKPVQGRGYAARGVAIDFGGEADKRRLNMLKTGAVNSLSVGFDAYYNDEYGRKDPGTGVWHWTQNGLLLEISPCDIPACPGASIELAKSLGMSTRPQLVVPYLAERAKSSSESFADNVSDANAEHAVWELLDGIWEALWETLEGILSADGDRSELLDALGSDLAAELKRRLDIAGPGPLPEGAAEQFLSRAIAELRAKRAAKGATTFGDLPLADVGLAWDAAAARKAVREWAGGDDIDWAKYRKAFAWYDADNAEAEAGYKLPLATVVDGKLCAVWRGVAAAMGALLGAMGGVDIPDSDRRAVYDHLARYYAAFDKATPEFKGHRLPQSYKAVTWRNDEDDILHEQQGIDALARLTGATQRLSDLSVHYSRAGLTPATHVADTLVGAALTAAEGAGRVQKAGAVLSASNLTKLDAAIVALADIREAAGHERFPAGAEPPDDDDGKAHDCCSHDAGAAALLRMLSAAVTMAPADATNNDR